MRIISGKFGGRKLVSFQAGHIRPTTDRVKEALFNILQDVEDQNVLDLFSGTGSLGLEAISRGAAQVTFVEANQKSMQILKKNIEALEIRSGYSIFLQDVFQFLKKNDKSFDVIFIDPPFTEAFADDVLKALACSRAVKPETLVAIESGCKEKILENYGALVQVRTRDYGDKALSFYRPPSSGESIS